MLKHLGRLILTAGLLTGVLGSPLAHAATAPSNCKVIEGPGFYSQACGDSVQVTGGPGQSSASTGTPPPTTTVAPPVPPLPFVPFTEVQPVPVIPAPRVPAPAPRPSGGGLLGGLLRLLGLGG